MLWNSNTNFRRHWGLTSRSLPSRGRGHWFNPSRAHHFINDLRFLLGEKVRLWDKFEKAIQQPPVFAVMDGREGHCLDGDLTIWTQYE